MIRVLAFDIGASNGRAILASCNQKTKKIELQEIYRFPNGGKEIDGKLCWEFKELMGEIGKGVTECVRQGYGDIASIGFDTWGVDYILYDAAGRQIGDAMHYRDARTVGIEKVIEKKVGMDRLYFRSGIQNIFFNTSYQLTAQVENDPELLLKADRLLMIPDAIGYLLTGVMKNEYTDASTTQLLDPSERKWNGKLMKDLGIRREIFGDFIDPGEILGVLKEEYVKAWGLIEAVPVIAVASHDTASAIAAVSGEGNFGFISSGTWSIIGTLSDQPVISEKTLAYGLSNEGAANGKIQLVTNIIGMWFIQQCKRAWEKEGKKYTYDALSELAEKEKAFSSFILPSHESFVNPENMPEAIRAYCRQTGQNVPETPGAVIRCAMESIALTYREACEHIEEVTGKKLTALHVIGGGARDPLMSRLTASATGKTVVAGPAEGAALGNALMQFASYGVFEDEKEMRDAIRESFPIAVSSPEENGDAWKSAQKRFSLLK